MPTPPARTAEEKQLEQFQIKVTEGERARERRDALAFKMWCDGHTQADLAERLDRADRRAGGSGVAPGAVQKSLWRTRKAKESELLDEAGVS